MSKPKNRKVLAMADSIIMERVADAAAECFYAELVKTEDFGAFEALVAADMRSIAGASRPATPPSTR